MKTPTTKHNFSQNYNIPILQHVSDHSPPYLLERRFLIISTDFSLGTPLEGRFALRDIQQRQPRGSGYPQLRIVERPGPTTSAVPLHFSKETYDSLLRMHGPIPEEVKDPSNRNSYSFAVLGRRGCHPVISINETEGKFSDITIDLDGKVTTLNKNNFCRMPECGYWTKATGRVPRHRLTHFNDRGFECQNPYRKGTGVPKHLECQLDPGHYFTRLDLFKRHLESPSCKPHASSFCQHGGVWHGPDDVDEKYLLPFTRDVHIPFRTRTSKP
jgi:hypothetical protein